MTTITTFEVDKTNLGKSRVTSIQAPALTDGQVLVAVERFALTANNVTYGVVGERIGYWRFFPTGEANWGVIPVWGVGVVSDSAHPDIKTGERLYGYWPMASHLLIEPAGVKAERLFDGAAHRADLPPVYNRYLRLDANPGYEQAMDKERMVLWPLYATSFCLYDFLLDNDWFGAEQVIIPSASSKTAIGTAYAICTDAKPPRLVGVTSPRNEAAVRALGLYDDVVLYDDIEGSIDAGAKAVIVDMSGSGDVIGRLHKLLADNMVYTSNVGVTHYSDAGMGPDFIKERSAMFFAPGHIQKRGKDWGPGEFDRRSAAFWHDATLKSRAWLTIKEGDGPEAVSAAWMEVLTGKTKPEEAWAVAI
ncbi:MAG: DUF2855 family protein [Pseudomonadota bacterium]